MGVFKSIMCQTLTLPKTSTTSGPIGQTVSVDIPVTTYTKTLSLYYTYRTLHYHCIILIVHYIIIVLYLLYTTLSLYYTYCTLHYHCIVLIVHYIIIVLYLLYTTLSLYYTYCTLHLKGLEQEWSILKLSLRYSVL